MLKRLILIISVLYYSIVHTAYANNAVKVDTSEWSQTAIASSSLIGQLEDKFGKQATQIPIVLTTPVNVDNFDQTMPFAMQILQELMTQFVQKKYRVQEIRYSNKIEVEKMMGEFIYSRNKSIDKDYKVGLVLSGTYTIGRKNIRFSFSLVNLRNKEVVAMESFSFPITQEIQGLLVQREKPKNTKQDSVASLLSGDFN